MINPVSWVDVDLDAIANNIKVIKKYIGNTRLLAVVKANAYGHGIVPVAMCAIESGADYLGVSSIEEGIFLRKNGINKPILVFNTILPEQAHEVLLYDLTATVCSFDVVQALNDEATKLSKKATVHVKIDTGLGRFGILPEHSVELVKILINNFDNVYLEGIYTHFSSATNKNFTRKQFNIFNSIIEQLKDLGHNIPIKHACNSTATLNYPDMHLDMVRIGNLLYDLCPCKDIKIKNPSRIYSKIVFLKNLPKGHYIGYGNRYKTRKPITAAIVPVGFHEGLEIYISQPNGIWDAFKRFIKQILISFGISSNSRKVKINGISCNILGKISMQNCIVDVTSIKEEVFVGDVVELNARKLNLPQSLTRVYHYRDKVFLDSKLVSDKIRENLYDVNQRGETSIG